MRERKFIHSCGSVGRVEDVVVSSAYRGKQLGKLAVNLATALAARLGCYKVTSHTLEECTILGIIILQGDPQLRGLHDQVLRQPRLQERGGELQLHVHQAAGQAEVPASLSCCSYVVCL